MKPSLSLFRRSRGLEAQIDEFVDILTETNILFRMGVAFYLEGKGNDTPGFQEKLKQIKNLEHRADDLRRTVESQLFIQSLIPESRADVLSLLESLDLLVNMFDETLRAFDVECPEFPTEYDQDVNRLVEQVGLCVDASVASTRAYFRDISAVRDNNQKCMVYESESDQAARTLKRKIFSSALSLDRKAHLRYFIDQIGDIADQAEDVADWIAIYAVKRDV